MTLELMSLISDGWAICLGVATSAFIFVNRKRDNIALGALLLFASVSFYHTLLFTFSEFHMSFWVSTMGGNLFQKVAFALVLSTVMFHALMNCKQLALIDKRVEFLVPALALLFGVIGYATHSSTINKQWIIDAGSHLTFLALIITLLSLAPREKKVEVPSFLALTLCCLIVMSVLVSIYEIANGRAWAAYTRADGLIVSRASGLQFNPNLLGAWLGFSFLILLRAKLIEEVKLLRWPLFALIGVGLFLSGSRGAIICLVASATAAIVADWRGAYNVLRHHFVVGSSFIAVLGLSLAAQGTAFNVLALRWLDLPLAVLRAVLPPAFSNTFAEFIAKFFGANMSSLMALNAGSISEERNLQIAMSGRFSGDLRDNGFLAAFDAGGQYAAVGLVVLFTLLAIFLANASKLSSGVLRSQMWALFAYLIVWSIQARAFQVYPIWIFMSVGITILLRDASSVRVCSTRQANLRAVGVGRAA